MSEINDFQKSSKNFSLDNEEIDFNEIFQGINRKRKFLFVTAGLFFFGSILLTAYARIYRPVYQGSFTLLISDPMSTTSGRKKNFNKNTSSLFEDIAINTATYETSTLITLLKRFWCL